MAEAQDDDPFDWEIDRVVQELCSSNRSWLPAPRAQFPDPDQLAVKIRDAGYHGEVLLMSLDDEADLWSDMNITATRFKQTIRSAIRQFRNRSHKFKQYDRSIREGFAVPLDTKRPITSLFGFPTTVAVQLADDQGSASDHFQNGIQSTAETSDTVEPPKKRPRRLGALDLVSTERPTHSSILRTIPTEADTVTMCEEDRQPTRKDKGSVNGRLKSNKPLEGLFSKPGAFWGKGKLSSGDILEVTQEATDRSPVLSWGRPLPLGRGRKLHVNSQMKRYLNGKFKPANTDDTDDQDELLPLWGESSEDYIDPDQDAIDREMEEEEAEIQREKEKLQRSDLQPEAVGACLTKMQDEYTTQWRETKLPGLQRKAYTMWTKARKKGSRHSQALELSKTLKSLEKRLDAVLNGLKENVYSKETELRRMGPVLEPPIYEIEKTKWSLGVLLNELPPEKISLARTADPVPKKAVLEQPDDGFDIWSEDESDGLDELIVDDSASFFGQDEPQLAVDEVTTDRVPGINGKAPLVPAVDQSFVSSGEDVVIHDLTGSGNDLVKLCPPAESRIVPNHSDDQIQLSDIQDIVDKGTEHWEQLHDGPRLALTLIHRWSSKRQERLFRPINGSDHSGQVWEESIEPVISVQSDLPASSPQDSKSRTRRDTAIRLAALFDIYLGPLSTPRYKFKKLDQESITRVGQNKGGFDRFWCFIRFIAPWFLDKPEELASDDGVASDNDINLTPAQKKKRSKANANRIQKHDTQDSQAQEARRMMLRKKLEGSVLIPKEKKRLIVNESKLEGQGLVFVHDSIAPQIKDHQIEGVRFLWDQTTRGTGCLLAHTMGLGKTMQVITLLTAIAEAAKSEDETVSEQIPEHLRKSKTLIICPSGILNNWMDELLTWAPANMLGTLYSLQAQMSTTDRQDTVEAWAANGGVLVIGYPLLSKMEGNDEDLLKLILESPSLVVGDEAHYMKNSSSKRGQIATRFKTKSRIALTGSPLANNVSEYYAMIDWVIPGFLGKKEDFAAKYANPIKEGLWSKSHAQDRRRARIALQALKQKVSQKIHRRTVGVLKDSLPPKKEFILYLDLNELQRHAYRIYMQGVLDAADEITPTTVWGMMSTLRELLAHPSILQWKLQKKQKDQGQLMLKSHKKRNKDKEDDPEELASTSLLSNMLQLLSSGPSFDTVNASYKMLVLDKILSEAMNMGENVLIFSHSLLTLDYIETNLCRMKHRAYKRLDGSTPPSSRQEMVKNFNRNTSQAFLIATRAGGEGLNIYGANRVVILDFKYNPVQEQQAIGRAYRIGQTKEVIVYWLMCDGTFEKNLHQHQVFKSQLASRVVDEKHPLPKADRELLQWVKDCREMPHQDLSGYQGKDSILDSLLATDVICRGISSIDNTETFEEEEENTVLSADDLIEANRLAADQGLPGTTTMTAVAGVAQHTPLGQSNAIPASGTVSFVGHPSEPEDIPSVTTSNAVSENTAGSLGRTHPGSLPSVIPVGEMFQWSPSVPQQIHQLAATAPAHIQPHVVGPANGSSSTTVTVAVSDKAESGNRDQSLTAQSGPLGQVAGQQLVPQKPALTPSAGWNGDQPPSVDPVAPLGMNGTTGVQHPNYTPGPNAPQPIMMNTRQRTPIKPPSTIEHARDRLKKLLMEVCPSRPKKVDQTLQDVDEIPGGLQKSQVLNNLFEIIKEHPSCAMALIDGTVPIQSLTKAGSTTRDKLKELLLGMSRERDPDV